MIYREKIINYGGSKMNKLNVLEVTFEFNGMIYKIYPVILSDDKEMVLIDCACPNF